MLIAKKIRQRLSNIQQSYDGHMKEMLDELNMLEEAFDYRVPMEYKSITKDFSQKQTSFI